MRHHCAGEEQYRKRVIKSDGRRNHWKQIQHGAIIGGTTKRTDNYSSFIPLLSCIFPVEMRSTSSNHQMPQAPTVISFLKPSPM